MRILIYSRAFWPGIGGIEAIMDKPAQPARIVGAYMKVLGHIAREGRL